MTNLRPELSKQITIHNTRIHYIDTGADTGGKPKTIGKPSKGFPILLGHSYLWDHRMWAAQIVALSSLGYRCIVPDLPGHELSGPLSDDHKTLEDLAELHRELMQALSVDRYVVVGLSIGGMWGARLAYKYPDEVKGLMLMDSFLGPEPEAKQAKYTHLLQAVGQHGFTAALAKTIAPIYFRHDPDPVILEPYEAELQKIDASRIPSIVAIGRMIFDRQDAMHVLEALSKSGMPIEVVVGAEDTPRPPNEAQLMADVLGKSAVVIPGAGHISSVEQPEAVNAVLKKFLETVGCLA